MNEPFGTVTYTQEQLLRIEAALLAELNRDYVIESARVSKLRNKTVIRLKYVRPHEAQGNPS